MKRLQFLTKKKKLIGTTNQKRLRTAQLTAAQLQGRLKVRLLNILKVEVCYVVHIVDASIILGMITNISFKFDTFAAPGLTEIQSNTDINKLVLGGHERKP